MLKTDWTKVGVDLWELSSPMQEDKEKKQDKKWWEQLELGLELRLGLELGLEFSLSTKGLGVWLGLGLSYG